MLNLVFQERDGEKAIFMFDGGRSVAIPTQVKQLPVGWRLSFLEEEQWLIGTEDGFHAHRAFSTSPPVPRAVALGSWFGRLSKHPNVEFLGTPEDLNTLSETE